MIDLAFRPEPVYIEPRKTRSFIIFLINSYTYISLIIRTSSLFSNVYSISFRYFPFKDSCFKVIIKNIF